MYFSFKNNFFLRENRDGFEGVQRRGHVKGAVCPRSSQTLDREHRWNNAGLVRRGWSGEKNGEKTTLAKNTEWKRAVGQGEPHFRLRYRSARPYASIMPPEENPWEEVPRLAHELSAHAVKIVLEACFLIAWALVIWGISEVLSRIEPHMPDWSRLMFKWVEIGFALFLLSQMFLLRVTTFDKAVIRAGLLLRRTKNAMMGIMRPPATS